MRVSPVFVAMVAVLTLLGIRLWTASTLSRFTIFAFVVCGWLVSLCLHEFAHAYVAYKSGDHGVRERGYLTLNPLRYSHPVLSIALPLLFIIVGGIGLPGGAVYLDRSALRTNGRASAVAAAGPLTNLGLAFVVFLPFLVMRSQVARHPQFQVACAALGVIEVVAVILNLLPIPPLDGFGIIEPLFTDHRRAPRRAHPAVFLIVLVALFHPGGPNQFLWRTAYRTGYAMGVPRGAASDGLLLARFWTDTPQERAAASGLHAVVQNFSGRPMVVLTWTEDPQYPTWLIYRADGNGDSRHADLMLTGGTPNGVAHAEDTMVSLGSKYTYYVVEQAYVVNQVTDPDGQTRAIGLGGIRVTVPRTLPEAANTGA